MPLWFNCKDFICFYLYFQVHFFGEYNMEGVSAEANEIYLEIIPDNLGKALRSTSNARSLKIKLTKKNVPCLTFEVELVCMCYLLYLLCNIS